MLIVTLLILALALATAEQLAGVDGAFRRTLIEGPARYLSRTGPLRLVTAAVAILAVLGLMILAPEMVMLLGVVDATALMDVAILVTVLGAWRHVRIAAAATRRVVRGLAARPLLRRGARRERSTPPRRGLAPPRSDDPEPRWVAAFA